MVTILSRARGGVLAGVGTAANSKRFRTAAMSAIMIALMLCVCTTVVAGNRTATIAGTAHDFSDPVEYPWNFDAGGNQIVNHCEVCHGPPLVGGLHAEWRHARPGATAYNGTNWRYAIGDGKNVDGTLNGFGTTTTLWHTRNCMGCHEGNLAIDDFAGTPSAPPSDFITGREAFGTRAQPLPVVDASSLSTHHPVGILYDPALVAAQGALEDPTAFPNPQGGGSIADTLLYNGNQLWCKSCHEQHNDRRFDLAGGNPSDDPEPGATSEQHKFLILDRLCFNCHTHDQPWDGKQHHIPGRGDPFGDVRGSDISCDLCHKINAADPTGYRTCERCHNDITRGDLASADPADWWTDIPTGHHGGNRALPYFNCEGCHADPLTGILTGNDFGTLKAPSCYECHHDIWNDDLNDDGVPDNTPPLGLYVVGTAPDPVTGLATQALRGTVDQLMSFEAVVGTNTEGDPIAYQWSFGDGSTPGLPSHSPLASHTYTDYSYRGSKFKASVAATDGVNPPIYYKFDVIIDQAPAGHVADTWSVDLGNDGSVDFDITFENYSGSLIGTRSGGGPVSVGIEFVGVIFWMELEMDLSGQRAFWGVGDMYFGNVRRGSPGKMNGVLFKKDGSIGIYSASGGAPPEH